MEKKGKAGVAWLRELILVQGATFTNDGMGGVFHEWRDRGLVWAHVSQMGSGHKDRFKVYVRKGVCLAAPFRILWRGCVHRIESTPFARLGAAYQTFTMVADHGIAQGEDQAHV